MAIPAFLLRDLSWLRLEGLDWEAKRAPLNMKLPEKRTLNDGEMLSFRRALRLLTLRVVVGNYESCLLDDLADFCMMLCGRVEPLPWMAVSCLGFSSNASLDTWAWAWSKAIEKDATLCVPVMPAGIMILRALPTHGRMAPEFCQTSEDRKTWFMDPEYVLTAELDMHGTICCSMEHLRLHPDICRDFLRAHVEALTKQIFLPLGFLPRPQVKGAAHKHLSPDDLLYKEQSQVTEMLIECMGLEILKKLEADVIDRLMHGGASSNGLLHDRKTAADDSGIADLEDLDEFIRNLPPCGQVALHEIRTKDHHPRHRHRLYFQFMLWGRLSRRDYIKLHATLDYDGQGKGAEHASNIKQAPLGSLSCGTTQTFLDLCPFVPGSSDHRQCVASMPQGGGSIPVYPTPLRHLFDQQGQARKGRPHLTVEVEKQKMEWFDDEAVDEEE